MLIGKAAQSPCGTQIACMLSVNVAKTIVIVLVHNVTDKWRSISQDREIYGKQLCVQLPTTADNVTLLAGAAERRPCSSQSISPVRLAQSSKPATRCYSGR